MRVLHVTRDYPPSGCGGVSTAVAGLVGALGRASVHSAVASFDGWRPARRGRGPSREPVRSNQGELAVLRIEAPAPPDALRSFTAAQRPDLIHVHDALLWDEVDEAVLAPGAPRLMTVHVYQRELNRLRGVEQTLSQQAEDRALARADRISAPSAWVAERIGRDHPGLAARVRVAGWGVEADRVAPARPLPSDRALYVGRFGDVKGTAELAEVTALLLSARPQASFVVAGGLPHNRRAERRWRERLTEALPAADRSRLELPGWLSEPELEAIYPQATATIVPSRFETFGLTALEAMAWGLPVVATRAGGLPELIEHGLTGLLCEPGDVAGLAGALVRLLADPGLATGLGDAARLRVLATHLWTERVADWLELYGELD